MGLTPTGWRGTSTSVYRTVTVNASAAGADTLERYYSVT